MSAGYLHKPPGAGRRVTVLHPPDRQMAAHVGYVTLNHLSPWAGSRLADWSSRSGLAEARATPSTW